MTGTFGSREDNDRITRRGRIDRLLRAAAFLPPEERRLFRAAMVDRVPAHVLANGGDTVAVRRKIRAIRRRLADPFFLLTVRFGPRLPEPLAILARLHFRLGFSLQACAKSQGVSLHTVRRMVLLTRALLIDAAARRYGGADKRGQLLIAALLGGLPVAERLRRVRAAEAA